MSKQDKLRKLEERKNELIRNLQLCEDYKKKIISFVQKVKYQYEQDLISHEEYYDRLNRALEQRKPEQWINYYDEWIEYYTYHVDDCEKDIRREEREERKTKVAPIVITVAVLMILGAGLFFLNPAITGLVAGPGEDALPKESIPIPAPAIENVSRAEELIQGQAEINKPVKWIKRIRLNETANNVTVKLPQNISNVKVRKGIDDNKEEVREDKLKIREDKEIKSIKESLITGYVVKETQEMREEIELIIEDTVKEVEVEYYTPAPQSEEEITEKGKRIIISGPDEIHYENVLAYTEMPKEVSEERIRVYRTADGEREQIQFTSYDKNNNGLIDYIEWIVPYLSEQTFDIVIVQAEHLDSDRNFIAEIYEYVNETDNITYTIPETEFARAYFITNLTNENVIDVYVSNPSSQPATIEIYEKDSNVLIGAISITQPGMYATGLNFEGSQDVFDLKSAGNEIIYDYIHDARVLTSLGMSANSTTITEGDTVTVTADYDSVGSGGAESYTFGLEDSNSATPIDSGCGASEIFEVTAIDLSGCTPSGGETCNDNGDGTVSASIKAGTHTVIWTLHSCTDSSGFSPVDITTYMISGSGSITHSTGSITINSPPDDEYPQFSNPTEEPADPATYSSGAAYEFNITISSTNGTAGLEFDGVNYTATNVTADVYNVTSTDLAANTGGYSYYWWAYGNGTDNNYNTSETYSYTINKAVPQGSITGTSPINYGAAGDVQGTETNNGDDDVTYTLYRNTSTTAWQSVSNPDTTVLGAETYNYVYNATGGQNYTDNSSIGIFELTVNQVASSVNLTLNNSQSNITVTQGTAIDLNCSTLTGDSGAYLVLYREGSLINNGTSPVGNTTTFSTVQIQNITCYYQETQNYTTSGETWWVDVTEAANQAPAITDISDIPEQSITEAGISYVEFSVSASDENGVDDLDDSSLNATFSKAEETTRFNSSCSWLSDINTTTANYTCTVGIWYWDGAGTWDVNATILDVSSERSPAYNETFTLSETPAMIMSPNSLGWATLFPGDVDTLSNDSIIINNTGNKDIASGDVRVKAYDLIGENNSEYTIPAANFTVNVDEACEGTQMQNNTATGITNSILPAGNNSAGQGQEVLYFCLEEVPNILQQAYSTVVNWIIDIV